MWFWKRRVMVWLHWLYSMLTNVWIATCGYVVRDSLSHPEPSAVTSCLDDEAALRRINSTR